MYNFFNCSQEMSDKLRVKNYFNTENSMFSSSKQLCYDFYSNITRYKYRLEVKNRN